MSNLQYYKRSNARNYTTLISHIMEEAVNSSEIIIMPCHLTSHWALLICWIKEQRWEYFDSLPSSLHRAGFMEVISSTETVSWADQKNWQEDMPRFRAEIVAEIFKTFSSSISESIARLDSSDA
ncbi:hypothetical protein KSP39_PZI021468 [Platanthera zijinensis]|uniref:Ubiquitin-like protease family profile domain-containing protein n=1 Tax=Platanthera zijinensis TaxID=2320716 RepID=A0AAP0AXA7_9ASPA